MDFVTFLPFEVSESIFGNLTIEELLNVTLVSKTWNTFIGESTNLMRNIKLIFNLNKRQPLPSKFKKTFTNSCRIYQHIEFNRIDIKINKQIYEIFKLKKNQLTTLSLFDVQFPSNKHAAKFIGLFSSTVSKIIIKYCEIKKMKKFECNEYENLKTLSVISYKSFDCISIFSKCKNLTKLDIKATEWYVHESQNSIQSANVEQILKLLYQNKGLKHLDLSIRMDNHILNEKKIISKFPFELISFQNWACGKIQYNKILTPQFESIRKLKLFKMEHAEDIMIVFKMPKLKELDLGRIENFNFNKVDLPVNTNIEMLRFSDINCIIEKARSIINAAPNVKELTIFWLTQEMMETISIKMKRLEKLTMLKLEIFDPTLTPMPAELTEKFLKNVKLIYIEFSR